jgi:hypothetical protein
MSVPPHQPNNVLPDLFQAVLEFHFCLLLGDTQPPRDVPPGIAVLSRLPNLPSPTIHAVSYLSNGNSAFELLGPFRIHSSLELLKIQR